MDLYSGALLLLSIILSTGRNIFSKSISKIPAKTKNFYRMQAVLFLCGCLVLLFDKSVYILPSMATVIMAVVYGLLLISAQWNYTAALQSGAVGLCSTVYSLGFIVPTISGALFWNEKLTFLRILGVFLVIPAIIISGSSKGGKSGENKYFLPLILAMLSSGGLGIMQKVQQSSSAASEKSAFILIAFIIAGAFSLIRSTFAVKNDANVEKNQIAFSALIGLCFAGCNLLNTILAGLLDSAVFFPTLNIGSIIISLIIGLIAFGEKLNRKTVIVLIIGIVSILLISLG